MITAPTRISSDTYWAFNNAVADVAQPGDAQIQSGWALSTTPPNRLYFNWVLQQAHKGAMYAEQELCLANQLFILGMA